MAQMSPRVTASWDMTAPPSRQKRGAPGQGLEVSERVAAAHQRVAAAMKALGPDHSGLLVDVCCLLYGLEEVERKRDWPRRSGKVALQLSLNVLARHYGLMPPDSSFEGPARVRHWGAPNYRPKIDGGDGGEGGVKP